MTAKTTYSDIYRFIVEKSRELGSVPLIEREHADIKGAIDTIDSKLSINHEQLAQDLAFFKSEVERVQNLLKNDKEEGESEARIMLLGFWFSLSVTVMSELESAGENGEMEQLAEKLKTSMSFSK